MSILDMSSIFKWIDNNKHKPLGKIVNQLFPVVVCVFLYFVFISVSWLFIQFGINPFSTEKIRIELHLLDAGVGFFLYFVTAVDYALIVGRMQVANPSSQSRFVMNVFTCLGCFVGVSIVLFLWGYAKEVAWLIIPILIFAGGVMIKLAYEGKEYYEHSKSIPFIFRRFLCRILDSLHSVSQVLTFWIPELGSPKVKIMKLDSLATWSFLLPFIIGLDDLVGYMGAMTIYNVFSLLVGIYFADILIDILIFLSPALTKKIVQSSILSVLAAVAFLYLAYKSIHEALFLTHEAYGVSITLMMEIVLGLLILGSILSYKKNRSQILRLFFEKRSTTK